MPRDDLVDALRGFALFGILAVNIQCFVTGLVAPSLGILDAHSSRADHVVVWFTAFLLEFKFYPIFSFCFGYGFAVQTRRWIVHGDAPGPRFLRRMNAMLFMGLVHGTLLWFGDILTRYALAGYVLKRYAGAGPRALQKALRIWLTVAVVLLLFGSLSMAAGFSVDEPDATAASAAQAVPSTGHSDTQKEILKTIAIYTEGNYPDATVQRIADYGNVSLGVIFLIPQFMVLFLLGAMAAQLGLLRRPGRYRAFWKKMLLAGLVWGLPVNAIYACLQWQASQQPWSAAPHSLLAMLLGELAPLLAIAYIAAFALMGTTAAGRMLVRLFAPAGRIALSMYVSESLLMALLLNGFGLGLGAHAGPATLLLLAAGIYAPLLATSHLMLRFGVGGPLEKWWRRYTYSSGK